MSRLRVISPSALVLENKYYRCATGRGGFATAETRKEGSLTTPLGSFALRACWWRADRLPAPATSLPLRSITKEDGWCDDAAHPLYNQHVKLPFDASHETLWREDHVYDLVVPLGFNDDPIIPGKGSAIFMHIARPDYTPTEGCVALSLEDLLEVLRSIIPFDTMLVEPLA